MSTAEPRDAGPDVYRADSVDETLAIEQRLLGSGYARLPDVLRLGGDFDFPDTSVGEIVAEAQRYLVHQQTVDLAGARILAAIGETAVKVQAFDAIAALLRGSEGAPS